MGKKDGDSLVQKSPAEFFAENKNIAGFDNVSLKRPLAFAIMKWPRLTLSSMLPRSAARQMPVHHHPRAC